jgi:Family of unknown function (DUF6125)
MDLKLFENMDAPELRKYVEFLLWHYRLVDAFWFLYVAEHVDQTAAERINERVWWELAARAAKDLKSKFDIHETGIRGFVKAIRHFPWAIITEYDIKESANEAIFTVPSCPPQVARKKRGLDEFFCKDMHRGFFEGFAKAIDDRIQVECLFAPPDPHPEDVFCKWRFFIN